MEPTEPTQSKKPGIMEKSQNSVRVGTADDSQKAPNTYPLASLPATENPSGGDLETLRRVGGRIQVEAWLVAWFSTTERFAFYALQAPLQNYIQNPASKDFARPGALGLGQSWATALNCSLMLLSYTTPLYAGILADGIWGPYKVLVLSCFVYLCGILILLLTSIPQALEAGFGLGGLIASFILLGFGIGGIKSSVAPFTADQVRSSGKQVTTLKTGERVIIDHELTVRKVYGIFYWCTNLGSLSGLASTTMEKYLGFWTSFLLSLVSLVLGTAVLVLGRNKYYHRAPEASFRAKLFSALGCAIKGGFRLDAAEPAAQLEKHRRVVPWDTEFVSDIRQALQACKVLSIYPIIWLCYDQKMTNLVSQAGQMITYGIPNDAIPSLNPICVLVVVPILERLIYPYMQKIGVSPRPTVRMTLGFGLMAVTMAIAAGAQQVVYSARPCYDMPLECPASNNGKITNQASVLLQLPIYVVGALGEMLFSVSGSEYAYNKAPAHMKSTLQAVTMFTVALGSGLGIAISPVAHNPHLVILFSSLTAVITITTIAFGWVFWSSD